LNLKTPVPVLNILKVPVLNILKVPVLNILKILVLNILKVPVPKPVLLGLVPVPVSQ